MAGAIVFALRQADTGTVVAEVCRKMGISEATFYNRSGGPVEKKVWRVRRSRVAPVTPIGGGEPTVKTASRRPESR